MQTNLFILTIDLSRQISLRSLQNGQMLFSRSNSLEKKSKIGVVLSESILSGRLVFEEGSDFAENVVQIRSLPGSPFSKRYGALSPVPRESLRAKTERIRQ